MEYLVNRWGKGSTAYIFELPHLVEVEVNLETLLFISLYPQPADNLKLSLTSVREVNTTPGVSSKTHFPHILAWRNKS